MSVTPENLAAATALAAALETADVAALAAALEAAREREAFAATTANASDRLAAALAATIRDAAALAAAGTASGLVAPDLSAVLAAAIERATPAAPDALAAIVAPDPVVTVAAPGRTDGRRTRRRIERSWSAVESGSIWRANLAGQTGRVKIVVDADGLGATFYATTGNHGTFRAPSRAVQSACSNPTGAGRKGEATVNGFLALTLVQRADGTTVVDGPTLDDDTAV